MCRWSDNKPVQMVRNDFEILAAYYVYLIDYLCNYSIQNINITATLTTIII